MTASSGTPRFDVDRARAAAARLRYNEIREVLEQVRVRAQSRDRSFSVDMGVGGAILGINLSERAMECSPRELSAALVETINDGMRQIADITNEVVTPYLSGADLDLAAITSGRLPKPANERSSNQYADEIEAASRIPKRPLGSYARRPASDYIREGNDG